MLSKSVFCPECGALVIPEVENPKFCNCPNRGTIGFLDRDAGTVCISDHAVVIQAGWFCVEPIATHYAMVEFLNRCFQRKTGGGYGVML